ncbi:MAG TPA: hypothetical protein PLY68_04765 [Myxococcota bacterium]|nr:NAD(P)-binding protein [Myxococcota bacterium]HOD07916.1 hypothetical protein [Myxococcota bacterium]HPB50835.1 hypothetical protein [Myxococcota bacterium]HQP95491.1 hypothetical protein [Myxococcota bacterium]
MDYDAIAVGAGTAGCVFASRVAKAGHRVLVLDASTEALLGHDWWDTLDTDLFDEIGLAPPEPPEARYPFRFRLVVNGHPTTFMCAMPPDKVNIERRPFAARLVQRARQDGVEFRFETRVRGPVIQDGCCVGVEVEDLDGRVERITSTITADTSGVAAVLRRQVPPELAHRYGFEPELPRDALLRTWREVLADTNPALGSVICMSSSDAITWLSREPDGLVDVFAGAFSPDIDPAEAAADMVRTCQGTGDVIRPGRRFMIPLRRPFDGLVMPGLMLIGDCACMAEASNGSGVSNTARAALMAADAAVTAIEAQDPGIRTLWAYPAAFFPRFSWLAFLGSIKDFVFTAPRAPVLSFMAAGGMMGPSFWRMHLEFSPAGLLGRTGAFLRTTAGASLLMPLLRALIRGHKAASLFKRYPRTWDETVFNRWRNRIG